jgi:hypothetical protein
VGLMKFDPFQSYKGTTGNFRDHSNMRVGQKS